MSISGYRAFGVGTGNACRFLYRKMKEYDVSLLHGGAAVQPEDGAEHLAHREAMGGSLSICCLLK